MKKKIALLLSLVLVFSMFMGCNNAKNPDESEPSKTPVETSPNTPDAPPTEATENNKPYEGVTVTMGFNSAYDITADAWIFQKIKEYTGIIVEPLCYSNEVYCEKVGTWIASSELPDMFTASNISISEIIKYGSQDAFVDVVAEAEAGNLPNFKALMLDDPDNRLLYMAYASEGGNHYLLPCWGMARDVNHGMMVRKDIMDELGLEMWTDNESFLEVLRAMKKAYPDSYPFTGKSNFNGVLGRIANSFNVNAIDTNPAFDWDSNQWYLGATSEGFHEMLELFQNMYKEGLMDPDCWNNDTATLDGKLINDQAFVCNDWIDRMGIINPQGKQIKENFELVYAPPIGNGLVNEIQKFDGNTGTLVANNENSGAALAMLDFLYSDLGCQINTVGIEGDNYDVVDGQIVYRDFDEQPTSYLQLQEKYGMLIDHYYKKVHQTDCIYFRYNAYQQAAQDMMNENDSYYKASPPAIVPEEDGSTYKTLSTEYTDNANKFVMEYITGDYGDTEWNTWVAKATATYSQLCDILNNK